jgi:hypothetical protein
MLSVIVEKFNVKTFPAVSILTDYNTCQLYITVRTLNCSSLDTSTILKLVPEDVDQRMRTSMLDG